MTTVIIIEDNPFILQSFTETIKNSKDFRVGGAFSNCEDALSTLKEDPDIFIVDIQLPGMSGIEGIKLFRDKYPNAKNIVVSIRQDSNHIFNALAAGAVGYLKKNTSPEKLIDSLNQILEGGSPMSSTIARTVVNYFKTPKHKLLSKRENEVLQVLAKGKSYAAIADELNVSINTIKTHTRNIYEKLEINSRDELIDKFNS